MSEHQVKTARVDQEAMARLCAILASDRARGAASVIDLPLPGTPECDAIFLAAWAAFRHVTAQFGWKLMTDGGIRVRNSDPLEAFVHGKAIPAHVRWAETEAMIRAGEWAP
jgi:hypothetical protein